MLTTHHDEFATILAIALVLAIVSGLRAMAATDVVALAVVVIAVIRPGWFLEEPYVRGFEHRALECGV